MSADYKQTKNIGEIYTRIINYLYYYDQGGTYKLNKKDDVRKELLNYKN